jgi:4-hydroxy-tetrahydrodipicolinate synthase
MYPMLYSFYDGAGAVCLPAVARQVAAAVAAGADGIAVLGLGGEGPALTVDERIAVITAAAQALGGRLPLCATVAGMPAAGQIDAARAACAAGADWVMLQPPPPLSEAALADHFAAVAGALDCPVGIQNAPAFLGCGLSDAAVARLARSCPSLRVVKAEGSAVALHGLVLGTGGAVGVFNGRCGLDLIDCFHAGAAGMIPGLESIDVQARIWRSLQAGDAEGAARDYARICPLLAFLMQDIPHFVAYGRLVAALRLGLEPGASRAGLAPVPAFGQAIARRFADALGPLPA